MLYMLHQKINTHPLSLLMRQQYYSHAQTLSQTLPLSTLSPSPFPSSTIHKQTAPVWLPDYNAVFHVAAVFQMLQSPSGGRFPQHNLASIPIKKALARVLVLPMVQKKACSVLAFRVLWRDAATDKLKESWQRIVEYRIQCDQAMCQVASLKFFVSAVTGVFTKARSVQTSATNIFPAISYWLVLEDANFCEGPLFRQLTDMFSGASVKYILTQHTVSGTALPLDSFAAPLYVTLKDFKNSYVRSKVDESAQLCGTQDAAISKLVVCDRERFGDELQMAWTELTETYRLPIAFEVMA